MKGRTPHIEHQANHFSDVRNEIIAIRGDMHGLERRIMDKIDENRDKASENQKWIIGLLILSMLIPLLNRPGFPGECFICELKLPDHCFRWKHNKLFLLLPEEYGPAFPAIVDCYTSPPTLVWPVPLLHGFSSSYGVLPPLCKDH